MEGESDRESCERVIQQWEEEWEKEWEEKTRNKLEWRTLFSMIFDKERADIYSNIFEERGLELREVLERGMVQVDIRSRGEKYLRYHTCFKFGLSLITSLLNKPATQPAGADPSRCNFTPWQNLVGLVKLP